MSGFSEEDFVPGTRRVVIDADADVGYRPLRSWHAGVYAGETAVRDPAVVPVDRSGFCVEVLHHGQRVRMAYPPRTVVHRLYWKGDDFKNAVSCFLSYPNGMGARSSYFWEADIGSDVSRFDTEDEAERAILAHFRGERVDDRCFEHADCAAAGAEAEALGVKCLASRGLQ